MSQHRNGDGENAIHDASESPGMSVASVTKPVVVFFEVGVVQNGSACPMVESIIEGAKSELSSSGLLVATDRACRSFL